MNLSHASLDQTLDTSIEITKKRRRSDYEYERVSDHGLRVPGHGFKTEAPPELTFEQIKHAVRAGSLMPDRAPKIPRTPSPSFSDLPVAGRRRANKQSNKTFKPRSSLTSRGPLQSKLEDQGRWDDNGIDICVECRSLDLKSAFNDPDILEGKYEFGKFIAKREIPDSAARSQCSFCRILCRTRFEGDQKLATNDTHWFEIRALSYLFASSEASSCKRDYVKKLKRFDTVCLLVLPIGTTEKEIYRSSKLWQAFAGPQCILKVEPGHGSRPQAGKEQRRFEGLVVQPDKINWGRLKSWVPPKPPDATKVAQLQQRLSSLYVIDCMVSRISILDSSPYVALSYVWGNSRISDRAASWAPVLDAWLPDNIPQTVRDAIDATKKLGYRYLWVDQYCIDQQNEQHVATQCAAMDAIYKLAAFTICAAAGEDADTGLPGVGRTLRTNTTPSARVQGMELVPALQRPEWLIANSRWAQRGWTYQEGVLSTSRMVFTEEQVYFEEQQGNRYQVQLESIRSPLRANAKLRGSRRLRFGYFRGGCVAKPVFVDRNTKTQLPVHLRSYAQRELSFESDTLKAFSGILNNLAHSCWGLPLLLDAARERYDKKAYGDRGWEKCLQDEFACLLCWQHSETSTIARRQGFPSFSWTGWRGIPNLEAGHMVTADGKLPILLSFVNLDVERIDASSAAVLTIDADIVTITVRGGPKQQWRPTAHHHCLQHISKSRDRFQLQLPGYKSSRKGNKSLECVKVFANFTPASAPARLLIIKRFEGHVERIGLLKTKGKYTDWVEQLPKRRERLSLR